MFNPITKEKPGRVDITLVVATLGLMILGAMFILSARHSVESAPDFPWYRQFYFKQIVFYCIGVAAAVVVCLVDYHSWARWSLVFYWGSILLLLVVLTPLGKVAGGARRWIDLGFFQLQPSELAKLAFIFVMASFLSRPEDELRLRGNFWKCIAMMCLPFVLILKEPDLGSALILVPVCLVMMFVGGIPVRYLARLVGGVGLVIVLLLVDILFAPPHWQIKLEDYQRHRLLVYFGMDFPPENDSQAAKDAAADLKRQKSYQVQQALITVGSGGLTGEGWLRGSQTRLGYLPPGAAHNDFVFSVLAEEIGFIGSVVVITLFGAVLIVGIRIASQARDRLGKLLAVGVVTALFSHVFINIGMNIRIMPVTGVPLPLLSYGGTSAVVTLIAIGVLQNVHLYRRAY